MMKNFVLLILILFLSTIFSQFEGKCEIFKQIYMNKGDIYLLKFPENYKKFEIGNTKAIKVEKNTKIFNDEHELVLSALQAEDTNLLVWTKNNLYIYKICINKSQIKNNEKSDFLIQIDRPPLKPLKPYENIKPKG